MSIHELGSSLAVYRPKTVLNLSIGAFVTCFSIGWLWIAISLTSGFFPRPGLPFSPFSIPSIIFPLAGLFFVVSGLRKIWTAILDRHLLVVLCQGGVVSVMRNRADAFRWDEVLTTDHQVTIVNRVRGGPRLYRHTYTVHCQDGSKFVFDEPLSHVEALAEHIEAEINRERAQDR